MKDYYTIPINFKQVTNGQEVPKCNLYQSVAQRIHMVLVTRQKEFRYDQEFGSAIWENDFENVPNLNLWKEKTAKSIADVLNKNEKRLERITVKIEISQEEFSQGKNNEIKRIKRRLDISVEGFVIKTNEPYFFKESIYVSPVWLD